MFLGMAELLARRSTCSRTQVGALIVRDNRILSSGYNGAPAGMEHCDHTCNCDPDATRDGTGVFIREVHETRCASQACRVSVHAELNAIAAAAKEGVAIKGSTLYVTYSPCYACAQAVINAGIHLVLFGHSYRDNAGLELFIETCKQPGGVGWVGPLR